VQEKTTPGVSSTRGGTMVRDDRGVAIVRVDTGERKLLIPVRGYATGRSVGVTRDGKWITYTETGTEGDIWMATINR
jgi:hypothetical protein